MTTSSCPVTILMPYRSPDPKFLSQALRSVLLQTLPTWILIIIHDRGDEKDINRSLKELGMCSDFQISLAHSPSPLVTVKLNIGMRLATTPFVCSLHCDDLLHQNAIEVLSDYIRRFPGVDYFHSARIVVDENNRPKSGIQHPRIHFDAKDFKRGGMAKHLHCWRVSSAMEIGGMDETLGLHGGDDYDFPWSMAESGAYFHPVKEVLYFYRDHSAHERLTTHVPLDRQIEELRRIFRKHGMSPEEIEPELKRRQNGYLRKALFKNEAERAQNYRSGINGDTEGHS